VCVSVAIALHSCFFARRADDGSSKLPFARWQHHGKLNEHKHMTVSICVGSSTFILCRRCSVFCPELQLDPALESGYRMLSSEVTRRATPQCEGCAAPAATLLVSQFG